MLKDDEGGQLALASSQRSLASLLPPAGTRGRRDRRQDDRQGRLRSVRRGALPGRDGRATPTTASSLTLRDKRPDFLSTHPSTPERVEFAERAARQFGAPGDRRGRPRPLPRRHRRHGVRRRPGAGLRPRPHASSIPALGIGFTVPDGLRHRQHQRGGAGDRRRRHGAPLRRGRPRRRAPIWPSTSSRAGSTASTKPASGASRSTACRRRRRAAEAKGWFFEIAVIQTGGGATYRFIFANEAITDAFEQATRGNGRQLPQPERTRGRRPQGAARCGSSSRRGRRHRGAARPADARCRPPAANSSACSTISAPGTPDRAGTDGSKIIGDG